MRIPSNWGTHLELAAFAEMFGVDILIITSSNTNNHIWVNPITYQSSSIVLLGFIPEYHYYSLKGVPECTFYTCTIILLYMPCIHVTVHVYRIITDTSVHCCELFLAVMYMCMQLKDLNFTWGHLTQQQRNNLDIQIMPKK